MCPPTGRADDGPEMDDEDTEPATTERGDDRAEATSSHAVTGGPRFGRGPHGCAVALEVHFVRHER